MIPTNSKKGLTTFIARRTELLAMSRSLTRTELSEFVLQYGHEPIEIPVAGNTLNIYMRRIASFTDPTGHLDPVAISVPLASVSPGRNIEPLHILMSGSYLLQRRRYLYIATSPDGLPSQAASELVRYALSRQGQQLALDLGHAPLSSAEIARLMPRWSACCNTP